MTEAVAGDVDVIELELRDRDITDLDGLAAFADNLVADRSDPR